MTVTIEKNKEYKVYLLNRTPKGEFTPPVEKQLAAIREHFMGIYGVEPEHIFLGPVKDASGQYIIIPKDYVWIPLPDIQIVSPPEGYQFITGYDSDHPEMKT